MNGGAGDHSPRRLHLVRPSQKKIWFHAHLEKTTV
jgi:hypothetical protein